MGAAEKIGAAVGNLSHLLQNSSLQELLDENERLRQSVLGTIAQVAEKLSRFETAMLIIGARKERNRHFLDHPDLFGEPAWDILLDLYAAYRRGESISISSAVIASGVAATTGLRCVSNLERSKLIERRSDPFDKRRSFVSLSDDGLTQVETYLDGYANWIIRQHRSRDTPPARRPVSPPR